MNDSGPFSISPKQGIIPPNSDEPFLVRFSPIEVDDFAFKRILTCQMKDLDPQIQPLQIELTGEAERPICHFVRFILSFVYFYNLFFLNHFLFYS
jgi:hydrocephalus-inducing protein